MGRYDVLAVHWLWIDGPHKGYSFWACHRARARARAGGR